MSAYSIRNYNLFTPINQDSTVLVTGGAGLIGSAIIHELNQMGIYNIDVCDNLRDGNKWLNLRPLRFRYYIESDMLLDELSKNKSLKYNYVFHLGACSSTTEQDMSYLAKNNYNFTMKLANSIISNGSKFIYASSAATYGNNFMPFSDDEKMIYDLRPLNKYGYSKQLIDMTMFSNNYYNAYGVVALKFSNVYGPNEYHKGNMRSMFLKCFEQIKERGYVELFKSYRDDYKDGEQVRDFLYVKDAAKMAIFFATSKGCELSGIYNIGHGDVRTWNDLAIAMFNAMGAKPNIKYIDMPEILKDKYQYYTCLDIQKIRQAGYDEKMYSLEESAVDYVKYLNNNKHLGEENE